MFSPTLQHFMSFIFNENFANHLKHEPYLIEMSVFYQRFKKYFRYFRIFIALQCVCVYGFVLFNSNLYTFREYVSKIVFVYSSCGDGWSKRGLTLNKNVLQIDLYKRYLCFAHFRESVSGGVWWLFFTGHKNTYSLLIELIVLKGCSKLS